MQYLHAACEDDNMVPLATMSNGEVHVSSTLKVAFAAFRYTVHKPSVVFPRSSNDAVPFPVAKLARAGEHVVAASCIQVAFVPQSFIAGCAGV